MHFDYVITSVKFLCNYAYTKIQAATLRPWFRGLDLGLEICGLGLDITVLIPITGFWSITARVG